MDTTQRGIITLIKSALTGEALALPDGFALENSARLIAKQGLLPLVYQGAYNCGMDMQSETLQAFKNSYFQSMMVSGRQLQAAERIFAAFDKNGIDYLPLKGYNLKKLYPQPELRPMGDADILIKAEQYGKIRPVMQELGFEEEAVSSYDVHWKSKHLLAELHRRLFSGRQRDLQQYFGDCWSRAVKGDGSRYAFTAEDEFVYIFSHMTKHFRFVGIGARQVVDLYVFRKAHPELDERRVQQIMNIIGLSGFYGNILRLLAVWFEDAPSDGVTDLITAYVFGNDGFGTEENKLYSEEVIRAQGSGSLSNTRAKSLRSALFPPLRDMQLSYNVLYRQKWLLPVYWPVRWVDIAIHRPQNIRRKIGMINRMTDEKVSAHQLMLKKMGLEFLGSDEEE